jgi:hypothetical protein
MMCYHLMRFIILGSVLPTLEISDRGRGDRLGPWSPAPPPPPPNSKKKNCCNFFFYYSDSPHLKKFCFGPPMNFPNSSLVENSNTSFKNSFFLKKKKFEMYNISLTLIYVRLYLIIIYYGI